MGGINPHITKSKVLSGIVSQNDVLGCVKVAISDMFTLRTVEECVVLDPSGSLWICPHEVYMPWVCTLHSRQNRITKPWKESSFGFQRLSKGKMRPCTHHPHRLEFEFAIVPFDYARNVKLRDRDDPVVLT